MPLPDDTQSDHVAELGPNGRSERGCRGCRSRPGSGPPTLRPDLIIAARDRGRDPELPAETVEHALAATMPTTPARYDLVIVPDPDAIEALRSLAVEFARHDHRVFWLESERDPRLAYHGPKPPRLEVIPACLAPTDLALGKALGVLRSERAIETAVVLGPTTVEPETRMSLRYRWGWRFANLDGTAKLALPRVRVHRDAEAPDAEPGPWCDLGAEPTWPARWAALDRAFRSAWPRATVIVVTFDNLAFTRLCLASLLANTEYPNLELLVVDNGSTDGTPDFLQALTTQHQTVHALFNPTNVGFGPANNQGLAAGSGDRFVLLNNDTMVPPGWLSRLMLKLDNPRLGLLGPATNRTCNEAQVETTYRTYDEFLRFARERGQRHDGEARSIRMLAMFCAAFRRSLYEEIGPLDERYAVGMFEDEDYALRTKARGYEVAWALDAYVHHAYHASIGKLLPTGQYLPLFRSNQRKFEHKWGVCWERHRPPA